MPLAGTLAAPGARPYRVCALIRKDNVEVVVPKAFEFVATNQGLTVAPEPHRPIVAHCRALKAPQSRISEASKIPPYRATRAFRARPMTYPPCASIPPSWHGNRRLQTSPQPFRPDRESITDFVAASVRVAALSTEPMLLARSRTQVGGDLACRPKGDPSDYKQVFHTQSEVMQVLSDFDAAELKSRT